jgi:hypothetical protein
LTGTNDLALGLDGGFEVRTFVSDATCDHIWHIDDKPRRLALYASPTVLDVEDRSKREGDSDESI